VTLVLQDGLVLLVALVLLVLLDGLVPQVEQEILVRQELQDK